MFFVFSFFVFIFGLASHTDVLRLVTRHAYLFTNRVEERVTRLRTSAWEAIFGLDRAENTFVVYY